ncbi:uncharacterized protein [Zea mays]|uniref:Uncharacterized protein n=1 Tax=Zea mays TaxID=4577 RepID=A0A804ULR6_MAIZE|nr:uncharacterized protein LOC100275650 isoform X2 [Zea mays]XP_008661700.1 uncharacterized protein LOC100275650 isoform X3 [Zea mays]XP_020400552.1 uncharacterized protein LOC100275650 isoform X1 [Zea mays]|eukprot:XP_008661699.1 uncharacterized protein LOC100275650 isoform X2 [Zea mays]
MQQIISACKLPHTQRAAAFLPPRPSLRRLPVPGLDRPAGGAPPPRRLVVRRRCQEENKQQQEAEEGSGADEQEQQKRTFLSLEEAGLVEMSGLSTHERFLCRLTISSLNLLRVISEQEGVPIEELNAGRVCDWFLKDKLKREQNVGTAVLQWDDPGF